MNSRERVLATLARKPADRVPRFEIWIDALLDELGCADAAGVYAHVGQDCVMLPSRNPPQSHAWRSGVDEWGRVWRNGMYAGGVVQSAADLERYSPPPAYVSELFDDAQALGVRERFPDHCLIFGTHIGPFTAAYMAMGFEAFFLRLVEEPDFVRRLLKMRSEWCIALYRKALSLGADVLVLGDDAGHKGGPMISPAMWRDLVLPWHRRIVEALDAPVIWHSDGNIERLLPMAVEAGVAGVHGIDPIAGMHLAQVKRDFGRDLTLIGNVDVRVLFDDDLAAVRREVARCLEQGGSDGGYMLATCNSISAGMHPAAVVELFRCEEELTTRK